MNIKKLNKLLQEAVGDTQELEAKNNKLTVELLGVPIVFQIEDKTIKVDDKDLKDIEDKINQKIKETIQLQIKDLYGLTVETFDGYLQVEIPTLGNINE